MAETVCKVFISYSRKDGAFAEKLRSMLLARGFEAFLDKEDILPGEPWRQRLEGLILAADGVVFVISPDSIASEICQWEVKRTLDLNKNLTPLFWRAVPESAVPEGIADRNYVFFDLYERSGMTDEATLQSSLDKLEVALKIADLLWVREHSKWVARAVEWDQAQPARPEGKLLPAGDTSAVEAWVRLKPVQAPDVPAVLSEYLRESIAKATRDSIRLRRTVGRAFVKPAQQALAQGWPDRALRLAAAGAILAEDIDFELVPELWPLFANAAFENRLLVKFDGHGDVVPSAAISPNGKWIATVSYDKTVRIWNAANGEQLKRMEGHTDTIWRARFHPLGGNLLLTESSDDTIRLWDVDSGEELLSLEGILGSFSPEGRRIVVGTRWGLAYVAHLRAGKAHTILKGHEKLVTATAFNPDGDRVVTASYDSTVRIWKAETGDLDLLLQGHTDSVMTATFSPNGRSVVTASHDKTARIWELSFGSDTILQHDGQVSSAAFSRDGSQIVTASDDETARVWDAETGKEIVRLVGHSDSVRNASLSHDGSRVVTESADRTVRIWDATSGRQIARLFGDFGMFSSHGECVLTTDYESARLWDARRGWEIARLDGRARRVEKASLNLDGDRVLTVNKDNTAAVWNTETGDELTRLEGHSGPVSSAAFSQDGTRVVTASWDHTARIWDVGTGNELVRLDGHTDHVTKASFSHDDDTIATASDDKTVRLWDAATGREIAALEGHDDAVSDASFSLDGSRVITASKDKTARIWDATTGAEVMRLVGHDGEIASACFSPDGRSVLTASGMHPMVGRDQTVRLWSVETGRELIPPQNHGHSVVSAIFDPTGTCVLTASLSGAARLFDAATGKEIVCVVAGNSLRSASFGPNGSTIVSSDDDGLMRIWHVPSGAEIACLKVQNDALTGAAFSPNGQRAVSTAKTWKTVDGDDTAVVTDTSRAPVFGQEKSIVMAAALALGVGRRTKDEAKDLLLQNSPDDLFTAVRDRLGDRAGLVDSAAAILRGALHPNCYLGFSQFADKFGSATEPAAET
jgi:WD40 repeat protein